MINYDKLSLAKRGEGDLIKELIIESGVMFRLFGQANGWPEKKLEELFDLKTKSDLEKS